MSDATDARKIIHVDMDAFYASVEQRDNPALRGKPLAVGGRPGTRGVVAAASYEARRFGVHSAMPASKAAQLCPDLVFVRPRLGHYREVSRQIKEIFAHHTDLIEPLSLDEAFLDVTENKTGLPYASQVARAIRDTIRTELHLTASAGVAPMKFLAKIASDMRKPDGLTVITPDQVQPTIDALAIEQIWGIGPRTAARMHALGIRTGLQLRQQPLHQLIQSFGKAGMHFHRLANGIDPRPVRPGRRRKSIGTERTFAEDILDLETLRNIMHGMLERICSQAAGKDLLARSLTLKVRYTDFTTVTRSTSWPVPMLEEESLMHHMESLIHKTALGQRPVRLVGLSLAGLQYPGDLLQGELWPNNQPAPSKG